MADWSQLGTALGGLAAGDTSLEYAKGAHLGAETQQAMQSAAASVAKQKALAELPAQAEAAGFDHDTAKFGAGLVASGQSFQEATIAMKQYQENKRASQIADVNTPDEQVVRNVAANHGTVPEIVRSIGNNGQQNLLHPGPITPLPAGTNLALGNVAGVSTLIDKGAAAAAAAAAGATPPAQGGLGDQISPPGGAPKAAAPASGLGDQVAPAPKAPVTIPLTNIKTVANNAGAVAGAKAAAQAPFKTTGSSVFDSMSDEDKAYVARAQNEKRIPAILGRYQMAGLPAFVAAEKAAEKAGSSPLDAAAYQTHVAGQKDVTVGQTSKQLTSGGTLIQHLDLLRSAGGDLENGDVQFLNGIKQAVAKEFGAGTPTGYNTVAQLVINELDKATRGTGAGSSKEREHLGASASLINSPEQLNKFIESAQGLLGGAMAEIHQKAVATNNETSFNLMLTPRARQVIDPYIAQQQKPAGGGAPAGGAPATFKTEAEAAAAGIKPGTKVVIGGVSGTWH